MQPRPVHGLFDGPITVLTAPVHEGAVARISAVEAAAVAKARDKRQREFATGRWLARVALEALGVTGFDLLNADDRSPIWPEGIAGTITHSDTRALVALGRRAQVGTIGLDVEHRGELSRDLWRLTLLPEEIAWLDAQPEGERGRLALTVFSTKEALYKAQYPQSGEYMGFMDLRVHLESGGARCVFQRAVGPFPSGFVALARSRVIDEPSGDVVVAVQIAEST